MRSLLLTLAAAGPALACANDPVYLQAPMTMEAGIAEMGVISEAKASLQLPIKTETDKDATKRAALAAELGVDVPYVKVGDLEIDVEWTLQNLDTKPGTALIQLNGANEYFVYDPSILVFDPEDDEELEAPGLAGDIPINVAGGATVSGLFTEDQLREASIDLDQITRGNINPFRASLTISKNASSFQPVTPPDPDMPDATPTPVGPAVPRDAFAEIVRLDLVFKPTTHMVLTYNVRVRDLRGILHDLLLTAVDDKPGELQTFNPAVYNIAPATP